jgi:CelD/BcsL family acetyltransferase involved in cellulose biosynthesis
MVLDDFNEVENYGSQWDDFLRISVDNHVFLTREWLETWWRHFGKKREPLLLAVINKEKIQALAPLMISHYKLFGVKLRSIEFIGSPNSDYHGFIFRSENSVYAKVILDHIRQQSYDCIELKNIPEESQTAKVLRVYSRKHPFLKEKEIDTCLFIKLPRSFEEYLHMINKRKLKNIYRRERNLKKLYKLEHGYFNQLGFTLNEAMNIFFDLHQRRQQSKGRDGIFRHSIFKNFHLDLARIFNERGWLRLYFLMLDGKPVSAEYGFEYGQKLYLYQTGFDPQYSRYGVCNLTILYHIKDCIQRGLRECDMMRGEHTYKKEWCCGARKNIEFYEVKRNPFAKAYEWFIKRKTLPSSWLAWLHKHYSLT